LDVEKGLIQIKNSHGLDVQVLPLNIIDVLFSMNGDESKITIMPIFIMCEESENGNEKEMDVGSDDWEGCKWWVCCCKTSKKGSKKHLKKRRMTFKTGLARLWKKN
jgi:hypothetical protein